MKRAASIAFWMFGVLLWFIVIVFGLLLWAS